MWKRYVDDILEVIKTGMTQQLTDHLNRVYETNSIKFTYEEEAEGTIPFLDTLLVRKESREVKVLFFRKNTHTDQYLNIDEKRINKPMASLSTCHLSLWLGWQMLVNLVKHLSLCE